MPYPIQYENDHYLIHGFRPVDLAHFTELTEEVYRILSDDHTLRYIPSKRMESLDQTELFLRTMVINFHTGKNRLHFIRDKKSAKVLGMIDLISPSLAREHYDFNRYPYFIEFYISSPMTGCSIMTQLLPVVVDAVFSQGIPRIGAVVHRQNTAARRVLEKSRFRYREKFDVAQDYYETQQT